MVGEVIKGCIEVEVGTDIEREKGGGWVVGVGFGRGGGEGLEVRRDPMSSLAVEMTRGAWSMWTAISGGC